MKHLNPRYAVAMFIILFSLSTFSLKAQIITTVAGNGTRGYSGDGGSATAAELYYPWGVAVDASGNLFIADYYNNRIRKVSISGIITTVAGNGIQGYSGDGGSATAAKLNYPNGVAVDASGNLFIVDNGNNVIRKVSTTGIITTVAGNGIGGCSGDGGSAISAALSNPQSVAVDASGNLFIADAGNSKMRKVSTSGIITTVAGNGTQGYSGDGGSAISAELSLPTSVAVDASGNLFIADEDNNRIRKVSTSGIITTVAGNGTYGYSGDGGSATSAVLYFPTGVAVDASGNLFIADNGNNRIRKVSTTGIITTVAGNGTQGYSGDGGSATTTELNQPEGVAVDANGNLFIGDLNNNRIREVTGGTVPVTLASFTAIASNKKIVTNWQTATELNTSHFNIQRSTNGTAFKTVGTVKAKGAGEYSFSDPTAYSPLGVGGLEVLYYRLEIVDNDGAMSYSKVVSVEIVDSRYEIVVMPNPVKEIATIKGNHIASVQLIDNMGRVVKVVSLKDATNPSLSVSSLPAGVYHLRVQTTDGEVSGVGMVKE